MPRLKTSKIKKNSLTVLPYQYSTFFKFYVQVSRVILTPIDFNFQLYS